MPNDVGGADNITISVLAARMRSILPVRFAAGASVEAATDVANQILINFVFSFG
jgi:hypothetical protein